MKQKTILITGANSGIGKAAAIQLAKLGHHVIMACRNPQKGAKALAEVQTAAGSDCVELLLVDMSSQASIRAMCAEFLDQHESLDVLIHNAAVFDITQKEPKYSPEGIETVWATNQVGPVLMTECLWPALENSEEARVLAIASKGLMAKPFLKVSLDDPEFKEGRFSVQNAYYQSKQAQIMYTYWLAERGREANITANCIRVPAVQVDISKFGDLPGILKKMYALKSRFSISPEQMAEVYAQLAVAEQYASTTGGYFDEKLNEVQPAKYAQDTENIEAVMALTMGFIKSDHPVVQS